MSYSVPTGGQIRAARALCRVEQAELAQAANLSVQTIKRLESFQGPVDATTRTVSALTTAFHAFGVVFDVGAGPGLRLLDHRLGRVDEPDSGRSHRGRGADRSRDS
ncbi:MAG: helix-turn-helix transcriptional regulator [Brevundimonas sp.]|uniref:helix-turn-helix domain-containing protein n=1 Tax=Brevundimonas sp. TaxID=1871086 RepID=UPI00271F364F|nr:helix-turn-helix transcriptional regulator [Brevundimonas sp.]MDO9076885.1 helix-turn-helix transcriptional regulator [Brevundimonas sp.]MDZ4060611.1 helix-turn-helix transcriptional regulator [Brevundimonas sp.]